jgi:hypothetical protein
MRSFEAEGTAAAWAVGPTAKAWAIVRVAIAARKGNFIGNLRKVF